MYDLLQLLLEPLGRWDGLLWLSFPALLQWFILRATRDRFQTLRLALVAAAGVMGQILLSVLLVFLLGGTLILALISLLIQESLMSLLLELFRFLFTSEIMLGAFARLGLLLVGCGVGWIAYTDTKPRGGECRV